MAEKGQSETPNHVRDEGSFPPKRSPGAGDGCIAGHCQPGLLLAAELTPIADTGASDPGICNGSTAPGRRPWRHVCFIPTAPLQQGLGNYWRATALIRAPRGPSEHPIKSSQPRQQRDDRNAAQQHEPVASIEPPKTGNSNTRHQRPPCFFSCLVSDGRNKVQLKATTLGAGNSI